MHLTADELIDLAERSREESSAPHLDACEACRHQLAVLRAALAAAVQVEMPEPSPLFWEHLSERVHVAVAGEGAPRSRFPGAGWMKAWPSWQGWAVAGVAAAVMASIYFTTPRPVEQPSGLQEVVATSSGPAAPLPLAEPADDPSLALVADLTSEMDPDVFHESGWTTRAGAVDEAVGTLTDEERLELQRLLNEELAKS